MLMSRSENFLVAQGQLLRTIPVEATGKAEQIKSFGEPIELAGKVLVIKICEDGHFGHDVCASH
jgi:hypothetical protein